MTTPDIGRRAERPNTVSGLQAKRAELVKYRDRLEAEHRKVTVDIDHLEASIALFDPKAAPNTLQAYVTRHRARKGTVKRFVMELLRNADRPLSSEEITDAWVADRGLRTDTDTLIVIRKRIGAALISMRNAGITANEGSVGKLKGWRIN